MASSAFIGLESLLGHVDQLEVIHGSLGAGRGRRHKQDALHRAGVVLAVAAWESYVENVTKEALQAISGAAVGNPTAASLAALEIQHCDRSVGRFNTPNAENVRDLFQKHLLFDPWPHWVWKASGRRQWNAIFMRERLNHWLQVRHSIAHGFKLPQYPFLLNQHGKYTVRKCHLMHCRDFVRHLASETDVALAHHLATKFGIAAPW